MREFWITYDYEKGEARHVLTEHCLCASELSGKTFDQAIVYLEGLRERMAEKWIAQKQNVIGEYIMADGFRKEEYREIQFTRLEIGWEQVPFEDQWDTCLIGIRPITHNEREGLKAEKKHQLEHRRSQYEQLKAEFEADS